MNIGSWLSSLFFVGHNPDLQIIKPKPSGFYVVYLKRQNQIKCKEKNGVGQKH